MDDSDTSPGFDYCFPDMALKIELIIEYHATVFMLRFDSILGPIEKYRQMDNCIVSLGKDRLYGLFVYARIKLHLPLVGPIRYDIKIYLIYQRQYQRLKQLGQCMEHPKM